MPQREIDTLRQAFHDSSTSASNQRFNRFYPFWKIDPDEEVTVRFLPDPDSDNPLGFLVENRTHRLPVHGRLKTVACLTMYGHYCPACETARAHFRNNENSQGKALYRRREYLARVAVVTSPLVLDESGIKLISLGPRLFDTVQKRLGGSELQYPPHDPDEGRDFHIAKSLREGRFSYHLSHFDEVSRPLDEAWKALLPSTPLSAERTPEVSLSGMDYMLGLSQKQKKTAVRERAFTRFKFETLSQPPMTP